MTGLGSVFMTYRYPVELIAAEFLFLIAAPRKKNCLIKSILMLSVYAALVYFLRYRHILVLFSSRAAGLAVRDILLLAYTFFWIMFCFRTNLYQCTMITLLSNCVQYTVYCVQKFFSILLNIVFPYQRHYVLVQSTIEALVCIFVFVILYRLFIRKINRSEHTVRLNGILALSSGILLYAYFFDYFIDNFSTEQILLSLILPVFYCISVLYTFVKVIEISELRHDAEMVETLSEMKENYYDTLKESILQTDMLCHDFKHQLYLLRQRGQSGNTADNSFLDELEQSISDYDTIARTGNEALDIVLTEKNMVCRKEHISFTCITDGNSLGFLQKTDIYTLFGNILDNAIEAVRHLEIPEKKVINLSVQQIGQLLDIQVYNYYSGNITLSDGLPHTTKGNPYRHGFGMKSIRHIVEKYAGEMVISKENSIFNLAIEIPLPTKE